MIMYGYLVVSTIFFFLWGEILDYIIEMFKLYFSFLKFLYQNFTFPILILTLVLLFRKQIMEILKDFVEGEIRFPNGSVKVTRRNIEKDYDEYLERFERQNHKTISLSAEEMSYKIQKLFGVKYEDGIPIGEGGGGAPLKSESDNPNVFKSHLFAMVVSEESLEEEYNFFGFKETIVTLYTAYLSYYKKDKWVTKGGAIYTFSNREESLEKQAFDIITSYYTEAMSKNKEWDLETIKAYQKLIRVVLVSYQIKK